MKSLFKDEVGSHRFGREQSGISKVELFSEFLKNPSIQVDVFQRPRFEIPGVNALVRRKNETNTTDDQKPRAYIHTSLNLSITIYN